MERTHQNRAMLPMLAGLFVLAVIPAGCNTPAHRIKKNPEVFASFPPHVQDNVRAGKINVGYTREMVYVALGRPDRKYKRITESSRQDIWIYLAMPLGSYDFHRHDLYQPWYYYGRYGCAPYAFERYDKRYERIHLIFEEDRVVSIDYLEP